MRTWEHQVVFNKSAEKVINTADIFSKEGWRLISVVYTGAFGGYESFMVREVTE